MLPKPAAAKAAVRPRGEPQSPRSVRGRGDCQPIASPPMNACPPMNPRPIAIITGLPEEADAFAPGLGEAVAGHPFAVRCVDWHGQTVLLACAGIGKVAAATAATWLAGRFDPALLMVIGTAGALQSADGQAGDGQAGGGQAGDGQAGGGRAEDSAPRWLSAAVQHDYGAARADGFARYRAGDWPIGPQADPAFTAIAQPLALGLAETVIASGDCFVECPDRAALIATQLGATLVDMETAAVAQVAGLLGLPWCAIKAATDEANVDSAADFRANLSATARRAAEAAERAITLMRGASLAVASG